MSGFVKRRDPPVPGSIPDALQVFEAEVRFYREVAPVVGVRTPACFEAEAGPAGTRLVLEDLSTWRQGADPAVAARVLAGLHRRFENEAAGRWPWLRRSGAGGDLVGQLYDRTWPILAARRDVTARARDQGERLVGAVPELARAGSAAGPLTLVHGDASLRNMRTGPDGTLALLDWEDVSLAPGVTDLAWLLVSSVPPPRWPDVFAAYGDCAGLDLVLAAAVSQAFLSLADTPEGSPDAREWIARIEAAVARLT
ncbi:phosphotransferase [Actinopolymorpha sp. B17G11]|uniref:phosphotransferase family protein n=1 Tax=Actinopolymorpha sp. B17G11 TaxID=3160861 RepID=UPI0032E4047E